MGGRKLEKHRLVCHPDTPSAQVSAVEVELRMSDANEVLFSFVVRGTDGLVVPEPASRARADGLWSTTCFECFLRPHGGGAYQEYNFSPSGRWAAYAFDGYREGMRELAVDVEPWVERDGDAEDGAYVCAANLDLASAPALPVRLGLSAIIEEEGGRKSYWALAHAPGPPDFHHPDCFTIELAPPTRA